MLEFTSTLFLHHIIRVHYSFSNRTMASFEVIHGGRGGVFRGSPPVGARKKKPGLNWVELIGKPMANYKVSLFHLSLTLSYCSRSYHLSDKPETVKLTFYYLCSVQYYFTCLILFV